MGSGSAAAPAQALDERDSICRAPLAAPAGWVGASMLRLRCASIRPVCAAIPRSIIRPSRGVSTSGVTPRKSVSALAQVGLHHSAPTCVRAVASPQLCVSALPIKFPSQSSAKPVRRMATIKERISAARASIAEDPEYYRSSFWILGTALVLVLYLWKEYIAGGSGTVTDVTEMTFSQRLDERRHGFLALMNLAADPAYRLNVANGPGTIGQLVRAVTRAKDDTTAAYALAALAFLSGHEALRARILRQLNLAELVDRTKKRLAMLDPNEFAYYTLNINTGRLLASLAEDPATYEEVVKVGGIRVASSLLAEENMHYTYTGAMLLANLAAKEEAIPQLIEARAYAPLMDWLVRTQDSKVPQFETKRHVIRALRSLRDTLPTRTTIEAFEALRQVNLPAWTDIESWSETGSKLSEGWEMHGRRVALSLISGFGWGYVRQGFRARKALKQGKTLPRTVISAAALNAYASAGVMLTVIGWESFIAPLASRATSPSAVKLSNAAGLAAAAGVLYTADKSKLFVVVPSLLSSVLPVFADAGGFAKAGYDQLLVNAMAADAYNSSSPPPRPPQQLRGPEIDEEEEQQQHRGAAPYAGPQVAQFSREDREWEKEKKQMLAMKRLRPPPEQRPPQ